MSDWVWIIPAFLAGIALGALYFGGLWLTVQRLRVVRRPGTLLLVSFVVRTALVLAGFYLVMGGQWERLVACVVGFVIARFVSVWLSRFSQQGA
jgi:F1F0 ATPase subunit 2